MRCFFSKYNIFSVAGCACVVAVILNCAIVWSTTNVSVIGRGDILDPDFYNEMLNSKQKWSFEAFILKKFVRFANRLTDVDKWEGQFDALREFVSAAISSMPKIISKTDVKWVNFLTEVFTESTIIEDLLLNPTLCTKVKKSKVFDEWTPNGGLIFNARGCSEWDYEPETIYYFLKLESNKTGQDEKNDIILSTPLYNYDESRKIKWLSRDHLTYLFRNGSSVELANDYATVNVEFFGQKNKQMRILKTLGRGNFGIVKKVMNLFINNTIDTTVRAVKKMKYKNKDQRYLALEEIKILNILARENCANVIRLRSAWEAIDTKSMNLLFDLYAGGSLWDFWKDEAIQNLNAAKREKLIVYILKGLLRGLQSIHERAWVIHCDLKPGNILVKKSAADIVQMINEDKDVSSEFHISDFGSSIPLAYEDQKTVGIFCSWCYRGPQMAREQEYGAKQDIWSIGIIAKQLFQNRMECPLRNETDLLLNEPIFLMEMSNIPVEYKEWVESCLRDAEESRPSARQLLEKIDLIELNRNLSSTLDNKPFKARLFSKMNDMKDVQPRNAVQKSDRVTRSSKRLNENKDDSEY